MLGQQWRRSWKRRCPVIRRPATGGHAMQPIHTQGVVGRQCCASPPAKHVGAGLHASAGKYQETAHCLPDAQARLLSMRRSHGHVQQCFCKCPGICRVQGLIKATGELPICRVCTGIALQETSIFPGGFKLTSPLESIQRNTPAISRLRTARAFATIRWCVRHHFSKTPIIPMLS